MLVEVGIRIGAVGEGERSAAGGEGIVSMVGSVSVGGEEVNSSCERGGVL